MVGKVADHLRAINALQYVSVIKLTGINTDTDEARLPAETPGKTGNPDVSDAIAIWTRAGYRPSLVVRAMGELATAWARAFPNTWMVLPIIPQDSFPAIAEDGRPAEGRHGKAAVREVLSNLVGAAESATRGRFLLQMDWLMADEPVRPEVMELAAKHSVPVAWQTNFYLGHEGKGAGCGGEFGRTSGCDDASFLRLLRAGMNPKGGSGPNARGAFIEIFPPDAIDFHEAVERAHGEMFAR
jgi:hypothetical protein